MAPVMISSLPLKRPSPRIAAGAVYLNPSYKAGRIIDCSYWEQLPEIICHEICLQSARIICLTFTVLYKTFLQI